jgi:F0F1-type ATP synthase assembly protein I
MSQESKPEQVHRSPVLRDPASARTRRAFDTLSNSAIGLEFGVAVVIGMLFGRWGDSELGTEPWLLIAGTIVGFAAGIKGLIRGMKRAERAERAEKEAS